MAKGQYLNKYGGSKSGYDKGNKIGFIKGLIFVLVLVFIIYLIWSFI
jgi:tetrahydromethanopterin S-methyltransferase subunit F